MKNSTLFDELAFAIPHDALEKCEQEIIHQPNEIQPFAAYFLVCNETLRVLQYSANLHDFLPSSNSKILGQPVHSILGIDEVKAHSIIENFFENQSDRYARKYTIHDNLIVSLSLSSDGINLQIEKDQTHESQELSQINSLLDYVRSSESLDQFYYRAADVLKQITGFQRVMVYHFEESGNGFIAGESRDEHMESFLGLRFPSFDVPSNAKRIYRQIPNAHVPDYAFEPVTLIPEIPEGKSQRTDLSKVLARRHSVNCIKFYQNMNVGASFSASIFVEDELWGIFTMHHREAHYISPLRRARINLLVNFLNQELTFRLVRHKNDQRLNAIEHCREYLNFLSLSDNWPNSLFHDEKKLLELFNVPGVAYINLDENLFIKAGNVPPKAFMRSTVLWLQEYTQEKVFSTNGLSSFNDDFLNYADIMSGILSIKLRPDHSEYLIWLLPQFEREVIWAGTPTKVVVTSESGENTLHARDMFEPWIQKPKGRSREWKEVEIAAAHILSEGILPIIVRHEEKMRELLSADLFRLKKSLEYSSQPIIIHNEYDEVVFTNIAMKEIFGDISIGGEFTTKTIISRKDYFQLRNTCDEIGSAKLPATTLETLVGQRPFSVEQSLIYSNQKSRLGYVTIFTDLSEIQAIQEEQNVLRERIFSMKKMESLSILAGGVAHDFNNLLMGIMGTAGLMQLDSDRYPELAENINTIIATAEKASDLTKQMLAYSGRGRFIVKNMELNDLIKNNYPILLSAIQHRHELKIQSKNDKLIINTDSTQVNQILLNLVVNASEAMNEQDSPIVISTYAEHFDSEQTKESSIQYDVDKSGIYIVLEVSDSGKGMDEDTLKHIFDPFFSTKLVGRGLGLAAVHGIARGHGALLFVKSEIGKGTSFKICFPSIENTLDQIDIVNSGAQTGSILVVDDEEIVLNVCHAILKSKFENIIRVSSGEEAIKLFDSKGSQIQLILLDYTMPGMNGRQVLEKLAQRDCNVPVVVMSGFAQDEIVSDLQAFPLAGFIQKPFKPSLLLQAISNILKEESVNHE